MYNLCEYINEMLSYILLIVSMIERMSYAGIKSFIMMYLSEYLLIENQTIYTILASFTFLAFFFCIIGSLISKCDYHCIMMSLLIQNLGYISIYFLSGFQYTLLGLSLISIGGGMLKYSAMNLYVTIFKESGHVLSLIHI